MYLADDVGALAAKADDAHIELWVLNIGAELCCQHLAQRRDAHAGRPNRADVGIVKISVFIDLLPGRLGIAKLTGGNRQFRVVPDDDLQYVTGADNVAPRLD